jgi:oxygen-independent coproporphyrinogen-3 oxidase
VRDVERRFGIDFAATFESELARLGDAVDEGFLEIGPDRIEVKPLGRLFVRVIAMVFDRYLREKQGDRPMFSRTV